MAHLPTARREDGISPLVVKQSMENGTTVTPSSVLDKPSVRDERHARGLEALYRISRALGGRGSQRQILTQIPDILDSELGMKRGTIVLVSPDNRELIMEVAHNIGDRQRRAVRYRVGEGVTGRVVETGKSAVVPKGSREPLFLDRLHERRKVTKDEISFICVPIVMGREVIGALSVD